VASSDASLPRPASARRNQTWRRSRNAEGDPDNWNYTHLPPDGVLERHADWKQSIDITDIKDCTVWSWHHDAAARMTCFYWMKCSLSAFLHFRGTPTFSPASKWWIIYPWLITSIIIRLCHSHSSCGNTGFWWYRHRSHPIGLHTFLTSFCLAHIWLPDPIPHEYSLWSKTSCQLALFTCVNIA
jgi:hypothetical protein